MIQIDELIRAVDAAGPRLRKLQTLYGKLPETECRCDVPGICCVFIPEMTALEALGWLGLIIEMPGKQRADAVRRFVAFYLTNPVRHAGCPLLMDGRCTAYAQRTFACRAYGLWSQRIGRQRTADNRKNKQALLKAWEKFGVPLPVDQVVHEMDYCDRVRSRSMKPFADDQIMTCLESVYKLSCRQDNLQGRFESEYHSDFSFLVAALVLGQKKAVLGKFAVIKEMVRSGSENRLAKMLQKVETSPLCSPRLNPSAPA